MTKVSTSICEWAASLPYWEQAALNKVMSGAVLQEDDYEELLRYLLEDASLADMGERPELTHLVPLAETPQPLKQSARLIRMFGLENVNALVPGQTLWFGSQLTAIFGGNGSGKSGYARVLGSAGFTRGDTDVLPDVTEQFNPAKEPSVQLEVSDGTNTVVHHKIGAKCAALSSFYVFDSTSVVSHLTRSHVLSFSPAGLSYLSDLADVTDRVRRRLHDKIVVYSQPHSLSGYFQGSSPIADTVRELGPTSDIEQLRSWAVLSSEERGRASEIDLEIARLKTLDPAQSIELLRKRKAALTEVRERIERILAVMESISPARVSDAATRHGNALRAAEKAGSSQFKSSSGKNVGTDPWVRFVKAAKALADIEGSSQAPYPQLDSSCLLCQQPLSPAAANLLHKLWTFLQAEAQQQVHETKAECDQLSAALRKIDFEVLAEHSLARTVLQETAPELCEHLAGSAAEYRQNCLALITWLETGSQQDIRAVPDFRLDELSLLIAKHDAEIEGLRATDPALRIADLQHELQILRHRQVLAEHLDAALEYVSRHVWAHKASKLGGSTRHITKKHNELFTALVTERYLALFADTLKQLKCSHAIAVDTRGRKGETIKQLVIRADPSMPPGFVSPNKVLSEGEKRALALADFLTEVALDDESNGIILDDPVTSLDFDWKETIVKRLVPEARRRQVIVFTHDLHFLYLLGEYADKDGVEIATHWVRRGDDDRPGYVFQDNSPSMERDYRTAKRARAIHAEAKGKTAQEQERLLREGFGALRTCYEAFVIFDLLNEVVLRFNERVSIGRLTDVIVSPQIAKEIDDNVARLSRLIEGHLHSDVTALKPSTPLMLMEEIQRFEELKKRHKASKLTLTLTPTVQAATGGSTEEPGSSSQLAG